MASLITFEFNDPGTDHVIVGRYDEMSGNLDLVPKHGLFEEQTIAYRRAYAQTEAFCQEHGINYFYFREVREALKDAGVDMRTFERTDD